MADDSIVLGAGCFWCTEAVLKMFPGIKDITVGYTGGNVPNPTYGQVCHGHTGHIEVALVAYDPKIISLDKILEIFFSMHDPTSKDKQGADSGSQYRSAIFYNDQEQKEIIERRMLEEQKEHEKPIVTEVKKLDKFYPAEDYHKDYYKNNPLQPYCMLVIRPKLSKIKKEFGL
jgi:peptide-methionine (S)-S-oxide reductase